LDLSEVPFSETDFGVGITLVLHAHFSSELAIAKHCGPIGSEARLRFESDGRGRVSTLGLMVNIRWPRTASCQRMVTGVTSVHESAATSRNAT
jgi:hypothetical protein